jgi:hypothetical protein
MTSDFNLEIYLRYKNEKYKELFGFEEVSEYFSRKLYKYAIGIVTLKRMYELREQLRKLDVLT